MIDAPVTGPVPWLDLYPWQSSQAEAQLAARASWPHALLLSGPAGIGKRTLAMHYARGLLCEQPTAAGMACGTCSSCHLVMSGNHPDLQLLEPWKYDDDGEPKALDAIPVDRVRAMIEWTQMTSHRGGAKVAIVVPAETMNAAAANALLKTLEEPPPATYLILVAHQPGRLPATVRSRCRMLPAPRPDADSARQWLAAQGVAAPAALLAQADHAPLSALALSDARWQAEREQLLDALASPRNLSAVALAAHVDGASKEGRRTRLAFLIDTLRAWTADLARVAAGGSARRNVDRAEALAGLAAQVAPIPLSRYHRSLLRQRLLVVHPLQPRLVAETLLLDYRDLFR